jgi:hypothetical protein
MRITSEDLNEGEVICSKCKGGGTWPQLFMDEHNDDAAQYYLCPKCHGVGKLDWIEQATGKPKKPYYDFKVPLLRKVYPKLIASELFNIQPIDKPTEVKIWQKVDTSWLGLKLWRRLLTIFSKGKEESGTTTSQENT